MHVTLSAPLCGFFVVFDRFRYPQTGFIFGFFFPIYSHRTRVSNTVPRAKTVQHYASLCAHGLLCAVFIGRPPWFIALWVEATVPSLPTDLRRYFVNDARARTTTQQQYCDRLYTFFWKIPLALREHHTPSFRASRIPQTRVARYLKKNVYDNKSYNSRLVNQALGRMIQIAIR